ncbi:galactose mutarotase isoform X1 [Tribolium castaneum]|uniref:Aldose 1-epimerase n=1 Tax=Tribolium castaneum TaxID=7070 RepID=A0A139WPU0_TRICA|nr:PREDICTED: aldose 1-epimerase isoform X1 [Tribolium castaneum]KYB29855.1 Aldose 1-epimerase-like protein [Tribolium castaneum]|eukprot:XP_008199064.1 PREDICTED: aldose 1-epimerase isoform X1 [Tribolium castaneum]
MVKLTQDQFDLYTYKNTGKSVSVRSFTWTNQSHVSVQVITYGATITSMKVPDKNGAIKDVVGGGSTIAEYQKAEVYFGATVGRVANRIGNGQFRLFDQIVNVSKNLGKHQLHGGFVGFDKVIWEYYVSGNKVIMSYHSADGEEGYPGDVVVHATFELTENNEFLVEYKATTTKPTFVNLTNHSYFNLAGHDAGASELYKHVVCINADQITEVDNDSIPTGKLLPVANTVFDLQVPKVLGDVITKVPNSDGFDHNFCINKGPEQGTTFIARVYHPESGRMLEVYSNQPGVQFYTSNFFPENPKTYKGDKTKLATLSGKGASYYKHGALCLETQNWPDAPNHDNFPKSILVPGETYHHNVAYKFSVKN